MPMDWREAFLRQARSDYALFQRLQTEPSVPLCHKLHCLQMATEKLAKALQAPPGRHPDRTHNAFASFVQTATTNPQLRRISRYQNRAQYLAVVRGLLLLAQQIEDLSPEGPDHPNPEYPWEQNGQVMSPLDYAWADFHLQSPAMIRLLQFLNDCFSLP